MKLKLLLALGIVAILVTVTTAGYLIRGYLNAPPESPDDARTTSERVLDDLAAVVGLEETLRSEAEPLPVTVQGRVDLFGACDGDAPVSVYALDRAQDLEAVMRELAREAGALEADAAASEPDHVVARAACDATGAFELTLPDGTRRAHLLAVGAHAYCQETRAVEIEEFGARATLLPYCGARVEGRVLAPTADGTLAPVEGALLHASSLREARSVEARTILRAARSDAEGRFSFDALPLPGDYQVEVRPADFAPAIREVRDLDLGGTATLEFVLTPGAELAGRVVDPAGRGVADAEVTAAVSGGVGRMGYGRRSATTDADGGFRLRALTPTRLMVTAARAGSLDAAPQGVEREEAERREGLLLVLEPGAVVGGRVVRADGAPAADELVRARFDRARQFARYGSLSGARGNSGEARTDAQGRFLVGGLGKGPFSVTVQAAAGDDATTRPRASAPATSRPARDLVLELAAPSALTGEVRGADGAPLEAFTVRAVELMDTELGELARDARERATWWTATRPPGRVPPVAGSSPGAGPCTRGPTATRPRRPVTLELPRDAATALRFDLVRAASVRGLVLSPGGAPIAGAAVT
ncbi:MAG: carboxypeptidase regulatory-like domain-containing protein [Planctomycetes bacterium]|nr:carboxypeptidase regulatory-like domain-containing protein [Planctomycetota bacterium]